MSSYTYKLVPTIEIKDERGNVVIRRTNDGHLHLYNVNTNSKYYKQYLEKVIEVDGLVGAKVSTYVTPSGIMTDQYYIDKSGMKGGKPRRRRRTQRRRRTHRR